MMMIDVLLTIAMILAVVILPLPLWIDMFKGWWSAVKDAAKYGG